MKKAYQKPVINTIRINTELPMASSVFMDIHDDIMVGGSDALGNLEGEFDIWGNKNTGW